MNKFTVIAIAPTVDPMPEVLQCLFGKCETSISNDVLDVMIRMHSFTKHNEGNQEVFTFYKRERRTDGLLFSFLVKKGENGNKVSKLECFTELGLMEKCEEISTHVPNVHVILEEKK